MTLSRLSKNTTHVVLVIEDGVPFYVQFHDVDSAQAYHNAHPLVTELWPALQFAFLCDNVTGWPNERTLNDAA